MALSDWFFTRSDAGFLSLGALILIAVSGCGSLSSYRAPTAEQQFSRLIQPVGDQIDHRILAGSGFYHRLITGRDFPERKPGEAVVVLFHGDGDPVDARGRVRADPGPSHSLLLNNAAAIELPWMMPGRPCYFAVSDPACHPALWTRDRYHRNIARSMEALLRSVTGEDDTFIFVAYSGGAVFAYELAARMPQVQGLLVLAGNMDVAAWVSDHGFSPMGENSLDPAQMPPLPCRVKQLYLAGEADTNIHWQWLEQFTGRRQSTCQNVVFKLLPGASHTEGWENWHRHLDSENLVSSPGVGN